MADNVTLPGTGAVVSTDEGSGGHVQRIKIAYSADGSETHVTADADGLLVNLGANNDITGTVTANLGATDTANLAAVKTAVEVIDNAISGTEMQVDVVAALPAGTNNIGDVDILSIAAGDNNIGNVDIVTMPNVTLAGTPAVDTELPAAAALADNTANPTVPGVGSFPHVWDGATWDRAPGTAADGLLVNLGANNDITGTVTANLAAGTNNIGDVDILSIAAGDNNIGNVDIVTVPAPLSTTGGGTEATALRVTVASDSTGVLSVDDNGGALTVDNGGTFAVQESGGALTALQIMDDWDSAASDACSVAGDVAHDGTDGTTEPVKIGARAIAHGTNPTAVAAADRTNLYANRAGVLFTIGGHPNIFSASVRIADATGAQTDAAIYPGTISAGTKIIITSMSAVCSKANTGNVSVKVGFGASTIAADSTTGAAGVIFDFEGIAPGSGFVVGDGSGIVGIGGDGEELRLTCDDPAGGFVVINYTGYTIES